MTDVKGSEAREARYRDIISKLTLKCHEHIELEEVLPNHYVSCCRARELNDL